MQIDVDVFCPPKICCQIQLQLIDVMGPIIAFVIFLRVTIINPLGGLLSL